MVLAYFVENIGVQQGISQEDSSRCRGIFVLAPISDKLFFMKVECIIIIMAYPERTTMGTVALTILQELFFVCFPVSMADFHSLLLQAVFPMNYMLR